MRQFISLSTRVIASLALIAPLAGAFQPDGPSPVGCPNTMATQVDARVEWEGETDTCGFGISVFGLRLAVFGPDCPDMKVFYPAHQTCQGAPNEGTYCAPQQTLAVTAEKCECVTATVLGTGVAVPSCECKPARYDGGHVEDFETRPC